MHIATSENRCKKIAIITTAENPFPDNDFLVQLCKNISATNMDVDVFALAANELQPRVINWSDNVRIINLPAKHDIISVFTEEIRGYSRRNHIQYDVLHAMDIDAAYTCATINDISGTPYIISLNKYGREHFSVIRQAHRIILHSNAVRLQMIKDGFEVAKLAVINDGFDPLDFFPIPSGKAKERLNIKAIGGLLLYVKNFSCDKNQLVFDAFEQAKKHQRHLQMIVLTDTDSENDTIEGITFIHATNKDLIKYYYAAADLFVTNECAINGKSNIIYEAMACGTPVLGIGEGMKTCIDNGKTGFIISNLDADMIAHKIVHVLRDRDLMQEMQLNAITAAHTMHCWKRTTRLVENIYRSISQQNSNAAIKTVEHSSILMALDITTLMEERAIA